MVAARRRALLAAPGVALLVLSVRAEGSVGADSNGGDGERPTALRERCRAAPGSRPRRRAAPRERCAVQRAVRASRLEDDPLLVAHRDAGSRDSAGAPKHFAERAHAHVSRVKAGHLTPITHAADVTKVILSAVDAAA
jgi:hypothetical protein